MAVAREEVAARAVGVVVEAARGDAAEATRVGVGRVVGSAAEAGASEARQRAAVVASAAVRGVARWAAAAGEGRRAPARQEREVGWVVGLLAEEVTAAAGWAVVAAPAGTPMGWPVGMRVGVETAGV